MIFGLGPACAGEPPDVRSRRVVRALNADIGALRWGRQIHGCGIAAIGRGDESDPTGVECVESCDALLTAEAGVGVMVWTADCVPVLLEAPGVVAAIHSGWRGTAADIVGAVVRRLETDYSVTPDRIVAALGPAISGDRYEVGREVIDALASLEPANHGWRRGRHVDLRQFLAGRLGQLGVPADAITTVGPCTASDPHLASYRRDGAAAGRQFSLIYLRRDTDEETVDAARRLRS